MQVRDSVCYLVDYTTPYEELKFYIQVSLNIFMSKTGCGCKHKGKKHIHKEPGDGLYKELGEKFWET